MNNQTMIKVPDNKARDNHEELYIEMARRNQVVSTAKMPSHEAIVKYNQITDRYKAELKLLFSKEKK